MFGFLNVNKPAGPTSHDIVDQVRRLVGRGIKIGHAGTLDPFADGVLVLCVGPATRLARYAQARPKRYVARITLGATSTTDDSQGRIVPVPHDKPAPSLADIQAVLSKFVGAISQVPPAHSAVHVSGRRAYELARAGAQVELPPRQVAVHSIDLMRYLHPLLEIDVRCGGGTYIRALARDIGTALGVGGYCSKLARTEIGPFKLGSAVRPEDIDPGRDLLDPLVALDDMPRVTADCDMALRLAGGNSIELAEKLTPGEAAALDRAGRLLAVGDVQDDGKTFRPHTVFVTA